MMEEKLRNSDTSENGNSMKVKDTFIQFIKFGLVGVSNTVVSYTIYAIVFTVTGNYVLASVISWLISVLNAYAWQNVFVFRQEKGTKKRVWWKALLKTYIAYAFTGLFLNNVLLWLWIDVVDISRFCGGFIALIASWGITMTNRQFAGYLGQVLNMTVDIPINFVINKFWAYKQEK